MSRGQRIALLALAAIVAVVAVVDAGDDAEVDLAAHALVVGAQREPARAVDLNHAHRDAIVAAGDASDLREALRREGVAAGHGRAGPVTRSRCP